MEARLHSWVPRKASRRVKERAFCDEAALPEDLNEVKAQHAWFVPALAAAVVMLIVVNHRNVVTYEAVEPLRSAGQITASNIHFSEPVTTSGHARNSLSADTFRWTNVEVFSTSSISSIIGTNL